MHDYLKPTIVLVVICIIIAAALSLTNSVTAGIIKDRAEADAEATRKAVLSAADTFEKIDPEAYAELDKIDAVDLNSIVEVYKGFSGGKFCGYAFTVKAKGYVGDIKLIAGINKEGRTTGVRIVESNETPGLGSKASEGPFISQFVDVLPEKPLSVVKRSKTSDNEIEAISGATITSKAVTRAIQTVIDVSTGLRKIEAGANTGTDAKAGNGANTADAGTGSNKTNAGTGEKED